MSSTEPQANEQVNQIIPEQPVEQSDQPQNRDATVNVTKTSLSTMNDLPDFFSRWDKRLRTVAKTLKVDGHIYGNQNEELPEGPLEFIAQELVTKGLSSCMTNFIDPASQSSRFMYNIIKDLAQATAISTVKTDRKKFTNLNINDTPSKTIAGLVN
mmetsp:Transcript_17416/g.22948  ORF Transcript_17416/g.22948 Transcript_17416/m.22948 type:complete len:156 (-) Transcript_17416:1340-1807(-)|eukprot:CAMPEP_0117751386 /NCGR_PEP_ID=MMETSP0947-20121206/10939_1 /TAXON_ID=44440 /ORGANISM="Chattonella subsalsa, Strain CCMP2191" /LENGTH=155 /DNA_ID=CAMNT_0005569747 /DNA_START=83 /DNA_END=550 /DNA_ORIENTATION=-